MAHVGERRGDTQGFGGKTSRGHLEYLGVDERMILNWILKKLLGRAWTVLPPDRDKIRTILTAFINSRVSIQCAEFVEKNRSYEVLKSLLYAISYVVN